MQGARGAGWILTLLCAGAFAAGCVETTTSSPEDDAAIENSGDARPGSPAVYQRIESSADCTSLQREFDIAMDSVDSREPGDPLRDVSFSYARAADNRLKEVGCYG